MGNNGKCRESTTVILEQSNVSKTSLLKVTTKRLNAKTQH